MLGVKRETLYAYASRGLIRSAPTEGSRARRYLKADLTRVKARKDARAGHGAVAAGALRFGEPVLDSAITSIAPEGHSYRGHPALTLAAQGTSFEAVCELLWTGTLPASRPVWTSGAPLAASKLAALLPRDVRPIDALISCLATIRAQVLDRHDSTPSSAVERARSLVRLLVASLALPLGAAKVQEALRAPTVAHSLLTALGKRPHKRSAAAMEAALVLLADHELNPSSFSARMPASVGADLYACVLASLSTLTGPIHGAASERVDAVVSQIGAPERALSVVRGRQHRGEEVPGFGHRLYPKGDPRAGAMMALAQELRPKARAVRICAALIEAMKLTSESAPTVDVSLVALSGALGLPAGGSIAIFAAGRVAGWIAHALEQRQAGFTLRPRARYVGP